MKSNPIDCPNILDGPGSRPWRSDTCWDCRHLQYLSKTCAAFPAGIPLEVWQAYRAHRSPIIGDNGIQYERAQYPDASPERYEIPDFLRKATDS